jgi:phosphoglycerate dehydrogenase-like enzyme
MKVLIVCPLDAEAMQRLERSHDVHRLVPASPPALLDAVLGRRVLVMRSGVALSSAVIERAGDLGLVVRAGAGVDNIDLEAARRHDVRVVRLPGISSVAVAELTWALLLAVARRVRESDELVRAGHWPKDRLAGSLLRSKTLGVVGAGRIGTAVAELGRAFGMEVRACTDHSDPVVAGRLRERGVALVSFDEVVAQADALTVHVPLTAHTRHMIDAGVLARMRPGSFLVNTARGGVVDEDALADALALGHIAGAALDVHETESEGVVPPLARFPNVVLTPHIGAMAHEAQRAIGDRVVALIDAYEHGRLDEELNADEHVV